MNQIGRWRRWSNKWALKNLLRTHLMVNIAILRVRNFKIYTSWIFPNQKSHQIKRGFHHLLKLLLSFIMSHLKHNTANGEIQAMLTIFWIILVKILIFRRSLSYNRLQNIMIQRINKDLVLVQVKVIRAWS